MLCFAGVRDAVLHCSVMSDSLQPHGLEPARLLCPSGFSRQEYWSGLPCPPPGDLSNPGIEPMSSALQGRFLTTGPPGKSIHFLISLLFQYAPPGNSKSCQSLRTISPRMRKRQWHPTPVLLPGESHGRKSLVGCSPWGRWESDMTERLHFHFSLSCIGEGNGNPLQCSCLENPRDRGACWAVVYGVAQSRTQLK